MENDKISIHRIGLLYKFYSPAIRLLLIISGTVLLGSYALCLYGVSMTRMYPDDGPFMLIYSMGAGIAGWVYVAGPFILTMVSNRATVTTLPASWVEKSIFIFSWIFIVYPLYLAVLWYGAMGICSVFTDVASVNSTMMAYIADKTGGLNLGDMLNNTVRFNYLHDMAMAAVVTLVIVSVRHSRFVLGIVGLIVYSFAAWLAGVIIGVVSFIKSDFFEKIESGNVNPDTVTQNLLNTMSGFMPIVGIFSFLVLVVCVVLTVRKIRLRQN